MLGKVPRHCPLRGGGLLPSIHADARCVDDVIGFEGPHIYNYRSTTHQCTKCRFNSKDCCNGHGRVVAIEDADFYTVPEGATRTRVCQCTDGWSGERCEVAGNQVEGAGKDEL